MRRLLYFCDYSVGGIAKNSIEQAKAIAAQGVEVSFLCPTDWTGDLLRAPSKMHLVLDPGPKHGDWPKLISRVLGSIKLLRNTLILRSFIRRQRHAHVMVGCYNEHWSPILVPFLKKFQHGGVVFGGMALDPVRDTVVGPAWWHRLSVAKAYSIFREIFVHKAIELDTVKPVPDLRVSVVPHGPYEYPAWPDARRTTRGELGIPDDAKVFISFGHLRPNKNLPLVFEAMKQVPLDVWLLVVGSEAAPGQTTSQEYQAAARNSGVADRVRWVVRYVGDYEVNRFFGAADFAIMTYSKSFRSTSGIIHIATPLRMPALVSCGDAPLGAMVEEYRLGIRVEPDYVSEIVRGIRALVESSFEGGWDEFEKAFSYEANAEIVIGRLFEDR
jgi:glycosyltransferase involved in cell wall biosynthesis